MEDGQYLTLKGKNVRNAAYPIPLLLVGVCLGPQLLNAEEKADAVANFVNAHLFENLFIHLKKVLAVDMIFTKELLVLAALDAT